MAITVPIKELRNTADLSDQCHENYEPIFVTKNGNNDMVVMSIEVYENMLNTKSIDDAISESEKMIASGSELLDAKAALSMLKEKHFG